MTAAQPSESLGRADAHQGLGAFSPPLLTDCTNKHLDVVKRETQVNHLDLTDIKWEGGSAAITSGCAHTCPLGCVNPECAQQNGHTEGPEWKHRKDSESHLRSLLLYPLYLKQGLVQRWC